MKKKPVLFYSLFILLFVFLVIAIPTCHAMRNWYSDEKPWDYKSSVWISEDPYLVLTVDEQGQASCTGGEGDNTTAFRVDHRGNTIGFLAQDENGNSVILAQGDGDYSSEQFTVRFTEGFTLPGVFDTPIFKLVFVRQE